MRKCRIAMDCGTYLPGSADLNADTMANSIEAAKDAGCGLICFPEACLSGYSSSEISPFDDDDPIIGRIASMSDGIAICFGLFSVSSDRTYIEQRIYEDGVLRGTYRKTHLGMNETPFSAGDSLPVIDTRIARIGIQLCWELHFPGMTASYRTGGAELILNPFASPITGDRRLASWKRLIPARSDDNRIFFAACNSDGMSVFCTGPDGSEIMPERISEHLYAYSLDPARMERYRYGEETMGNIDYPKHFRDDLYTERL